MVDSMRSDLMSRIKGKNTKPELILRKALWHTGMRYRLHAETPAGRPDLVFPGSSVAVFVDGCFWHGCPDHYVSPRTRRIFWGDKLNENVQRDRRQTKKLEAEGWRVCRVWEHLIHEELDDAINRVKNAVEEDSSFSPRADWRVVSVTTIDEEKDMEERVLQKLRDAEAEKVERRKRSTKKW